MLTKFIPVPQPNEVDDEIVLQATINAMLDSAVPLYDEANEGLAEANLALTSPMFANTRNRLVKVTFELVPETETHD